MAIKVFGICGKKQSGKNSLCNFFKELLPDLRVTEFAFAKALKDLAINEFGIPAKSCYGSDGDKNYPIATWGRFFNNFFIEKKYNKKTDDFLSGREFLQILGTDVMREGRFDKMSDVKYMVLLDKWVREKFGQNAFQNKFNFKNIWANVLVEDVKKASDSFDIITVSDIRFFNEIDALKSIDAKLIRLYRDAGTTDSIPHPSELEMERMDDDSFNYVLEPEDNKNLTQLRAFTIKILMSEGLIPMGGILI